MQAVLHVDLIDDIFELVNAVIALGYDLVCGVDDFGSVDHVDCGYYDYRYDGYDRCHRFATYSCALFVCAQIRVECEHIGVFFMIVPGSLVSGVVEFPFLMSCEITKIKSHIDLVSISAEYCL